MTTQPEVILENNLVKQLTELGYDRVQIHDEVSILSNLKNQLERFNNTSFSDKEFNAILNHLEKGNVFEKFNNPVNPAPDFFLSFPTTQTQLERQLHCALRSCFIEYFIFYIE